MRFEGRVVVVTGAASGMGAACARLFDLEGASVVLVDIDGPGARALAGELAGESGGGLAIVGDVSDPSFCAEAITTAVENFGRLDVLVNAAGVIARADALGTDDMAWRRVMDVNAGGVFYMSREAIRAMLPAETGTIVNFGSIWGNVGATGVVAYCASKGAVHQITRAMALDHATNGIRVNAVCPGEVNTPMLASGRRTPPSAEDLRRLAVDTIPMQRLADPEEVARVVLFLSSDDAAYMTGALVTVDAGYTAR